MDNKDAIDGLKFIKLFYSNKKRDTSLSDFDIEALDKAIASLEAWDKVKEEMKYFYNVYDSYNEEELTKEELWTVSLGKRHYKHALEIINKHLGE